MKLKLCKRLLVLSLSCAILAINTIGAQANPVFSQKSSTFSKAWEKTIKAYYGSGTEALVGVMVYGYNTVAINEDYVWTQSLSYRSQPSIENGNGTHTGKFKKGSLGYSKLEVSHRKKTDNSVKFKMTLETTTSASKFSKSSPKDSNIKLRK